MRPVGAPWWFGSASWTTVRVLSGGSGSSLARSVELFAGCGGLALGIARSGFSHELIVECDEVSVATLRENKKRNVKHVRDWEIVEDDTRRLDFREMSGIDLISGGPPCQPFSIGGKHLGPNDPRNMWPEAIRAIREARPKAFVFENVRGLFRPAFSEYLEYITLQFSYPDLTPRSGEKWECHLKRLRSHTKSSKLRCPEYRVVSRAINAADFGAPQKRYRAIIIGADSTFFRLISDFLTCCLVLTIPGSVWQNLKNHPRCLNIMKRV